VFSELDQGFTGRVLDQKGEPVAGVTVEIYDSKDRLLGAVSTDKEGRYTFG
jgi:protocatechuate 3,4-dioxygenase beta subunit